MAAVAPMPAAVSLPAGFHIVDPLRDSRWDELVDTHPRSSIFHCSGWLRALALTYRYRPLVLTPDAADDRLTQALVFCEVRSLITGSRLVSLPFADHCDLLTKSLDDAPAFWNALRSLQAAHPWKYVELRPLGWPQNFAFEAAGDSFWFHTLDLNAPLERLFRNLHRSCVQRRILHAERQHLSFERGCSSRLLDDFYRLLLITRRRHRLLPQPRAWFRNLAACLQSGLEIRMLRRDETPIAAIVSLRHRQTVVYKYGCSDERYHHLSGMPLLFWKLIEQSKEEGAGLIDFGRTALDNSGLTAFKDRLGAARSSVTYLRSPRGNAASAFPPGARAFVSCLPDALSSRLGALVYRHMG